MRILWVTKTFQSMGHKTTKIEIAHWLSVLGHTVHLVMARELSEKVTKDNQDHIPTVPTKVVSGILFGLLAFLILPLKVLKHRVDVVVVDASKVWLPFILSLKLVRTTIILDIRTLPIDKEKSFLFDITMRLSRLSVSGYTTITQELKDTLMKNYGITDESIGIWSSGVSFEKFPQTQKKETGSELTLLYHGSYSPTRGIDQLIQAMKPVSQDLGNKVHLFIIGFEPSIIRKYNTILDREGLSSVVTILPAVSYEEISSYIARSDIGIIPLPPELVWWRVSVPLKTLEYLAMGKPIIATNIPFHKKIFSQANCGILVESSQPDSLAKAIIQMYQNRAHLSDMGAAGRNAIHDEFTWESQARHLSQFLTRVREDRCNKSSK